MPMEARDVGYPCSWSYQAVAICLMWALGTELRFFAKAIHMLSHCAKHLTLMAKKAVCEWISSSSENHGE